MTKSTLEILLTINEVEEVHLLRLLILLQTLSGRKEKTVVDISRLAKMDFLLQFPAALDQILLEIENSSDVELSQSEKNNIETKMMYFKYSPWSGQNRRRLVLLEAKRLIFWQLSKKGVEIGLTSIGVNVVDKCSRDDYMKSFFVRSKIIKRKIFTLSDKRLDEAMVAVINNRFRL